MTFEQNALLLLLTNKSPYKYIDFSVFDSVNSRQCVILLYGNRCSKTPRAV